MCRRDAAIVLLNQVAGPAPGERQLRRKLRHQRGPAGLHRLLGIEQPTTSRTPIIIIVVRTYCITASFATRPARSHIGLRSPGT